MRLSEPLAAGDAAHAPALVRHQRITADHSAASAAVAAPLAAHDDARSSPPFLAAAHAPCEATSLPSVLSPLQAHA